MMLWSLTIESAIVRSLNKVNYENIAESIVNNSHLGKNTFIIGDMIYNGCQAFHINELDKVCFENGVSVIDKNDLLSN